MKTYECAVVGRTCIDFIAIVEKYPKKNTKVPLIKYDICLGGQAANAAVVPSELGVKTVLLSYVGNDEYGKLAKKFLSKHKNLDVILNKSSYTPCAFIWTEKQTAERTIVYQKIESDTLYFKNLIKKISSKTKYILFDHQSSKSIFNAILEIRKNKVKIMMDAEREDPYMFKLLKYINYLIFSKEIVKFLKINVKQLLRKFIKLGPEIVCCTLGEEGAIAMVKDSDKIYYSKAIKVKPVDTTGAGDVFHAGFMYGIIKQWRIQDILSFSNKLAGLSTKYIGGSSFVHSAAKTFPNAGLGIGVGSRGLIWISTLSNW
ncbi:MAG: carbohydrate kinase family protein [Endomicrobia bacterium]|nr:carbohydrate kinase family protein [Endomicrobiia bacterium]